MNAVNKTKKNRKKKWERERELFAIFSVRRIAHSHVHFQIAICARREQKAYVQKLIK